VTFLHKFVHNVLQEYICCCWTSWHDHR